MNPLHNIDAVVEHSMHSGEVAGMALVVVKDDEIVLAKGYGVRERGKADPVDAETIFAIASNTKAFTATAIGLLVHEGKIQWDDRVRNYLPHFEMHDPYVTHDIRVRDLLCHRSGLGTWAGDLMGLSCYAREEVLHRIRFIEPAFPFRGGFGYSNLMFAVAGAVIETVSGISWDDFIRQRFFEPLGMSRSSTSTLDLPRFQNVAIPHVKTDEGIVTVPYRNLDSTAPCGSINSCVSDIAQWLRLQLANGMHNGTQIVAPEIIEETRTPHNPVRILPAIRKLFPTRHLAAYGLGWTLADHYGRLLVGHTGGMDGMISVTLMLPEENLGIIVLTNSIPHYAHLEVAYTIIDRFLGMPEDDWNAKYREFDEAAKSEARAKQIAIESARVPNTQPSLPRAAFVGSYTNPIYGSATINEESGALVVRLNTHPDVIGTLEHWHYDTFLCRWSDSTFDKSLIPFLSDGQGHIAAFNVKVREDWIDPLDYHFTRIAEA